MFEIITGIVGLIIGVFFGVKIKKSELDEIISLRESQKKADQNEYLQVLLRNLSHILIVRDLNTYCKLRRRTSDKVKEFRGYSASLKLSKLSLISERYPYINDFDKMNVKEFILPFDAASVFSTEELFEVYEDIHIFLAGNDNTYINSQEVINRNEAHFEKYVQRIKDTTFKQRTLREIGAYLNAKAATKENNLSYKLRDIEILPINHFAETRYGLHFKDTNEYAIYGVFYDDNNKAYESIYRSDKSFEVEDVLDTSFIEFVYEKQLEELS